MSGQWAEAAENYQKGLDLAPQYVDLTLGLARCRLRMDKRETAMKLILPILNSKAPVDSGAFLVLGMYYLDRQEYPQAKKALIKGAELSKGDSDFHLLLARVAEQENLYGEALQEYAKVAELTPEDAQARSRLLSLQAQQKASNQ
jgi:tetratricopeptide (TPR) repeat protein